MAKKEELSGKLTDRIKEKRAEISSYITRIKKRSDRLSQISIICTAATSVLVAGPAFGGEKFTQLLQQIFNLPADSVVWRVLCLAGMILSLAATIANNLTKVGSTADQLSRAQTARSLLERLEISLDFGQTSPEEAAKLFQQYLGELPAMDEK